MRLLPATLLLQIVLALVLAARPTAAAAQEFGFEPPPSATDSALPAALRDLAERIVPIYRDDDSTRYLSNLAALQMTAGDPESAHETRIALDKRLQSKEGRSATGRASVYAVYVQARMTEAQEHVSFASAYKQAFRATFDPLDDLAAYELEPFFLASNEPLREAVQHELDQQRDKKEIALEPALDLVRAWAGFEAYRSIEGLVRPLLAAENERRYVEEEVAIPVAEGATVAATVFRPRAATETGKVATLLEFTLDRSSRDARESAAHGYASVLALARIAGDPAARPGAPFESDGDDARAAIDWIAKQPWSDGRVGMQGTGYGGFVAWSAAKKLPPELKAIATSDPMAPGIDVPMRGRIVLSSAYRWVYEMLSPPEGNSANDATHWRKLDEDWYRAGGSYREFATLPGPGSVIFRRWLNHPSYDRFWQKWLPFGSEFAKVDIPALTVTGYYSAGQTAALYYFTEHHKQSPNADHTLLIGPFDEQSVEKGVTEPTIRGSTPDDVARIDPNAARYAWFAHVLGGADRAELISDTVNYEVAGANEWRHEASLGALEQKRTRFYLEAAPGGTVNTLAAKKRRSPTSLTATMSLRDRRDADWRPSREIVLDVLPARNGTALFMTEPFSSPVDVAGRLSGVLDFTINKQDVDLVMMLYELRSTGEYVKLFDPAYAFRASYAKDRVHRHLLVAGVRQQLPFQSEKMVGHQLQAGSRLVLALGINKRADSQVNYGSGKDVSEETIADGHAPVRIRWHDGSFIEIPSP
jgi:uncharacterized protein